MAAIFLSLFVVSFCWFSTTQADGTNYKNYIVIQTNPETPEQIEALRDLEQQHSLDWKVDFWNPPSLASNGVLIGVPEESSAMVKDYLSTAGISYSITIRDFQQVIDQELQANPRQFSPFSRASSFAFDQYHRVDEIDSYIHKLARDHPDLVQVQVLAKTYENRNINGIQIGLKSSSSKPIFYIDAGIHAREWIAPATALYIINELVTKANTDAYIKGLLTKFDFFIIPTLNPDGYAYTWSNDRMWRKNRSNPRPTSGCRGVDLNRNFPLGFAGASTSTNPCDYQLYCGPEAFSEIEAKVVKKYTEANAHRMKVTITIHSYGNMWLFPWGYKRGRTTDYYTTLAGAQAGVRAIRSVNGNNYQLGTTTEVLYAAGGGSDDWQYSVTKNPYTYTLEISNGGFNLPNRYIIPTALETWTGLKALADTI